MRRASFRRHVTCDRRAANPQSLCDTYICDINNLAQTVAAASTSSSSSSICQPFTNQFETIRKPLWASANDDDDDCQTICSFATTNCEGHHRRFGMYVCVSNVCKCEKYAKNFGCVAIDEWVSAIGDVGWSLGVSSAKCGVEWSYFALDAVDRGVHCRWWEVHYCGELSIDFSGTQRRTGWIHSDVCFRLGGVELFHSICCKTVCST